MGPFLCENIYRIKDCLIIIWWKELGGIVMQISNINVVVTEKDLYSIINDVLKEYVEVDGLVIDKVLIDKTIIVSGTYKYKVTIPFTINISVERVENNIVYLSIEKINVKNLKIFKGIINIALKIISSKVEHLGIEFNEEIIKIKLDKLCEIIPMVDFKLKGLKIIPYGLEAEVSDFNFYSDNKDVEIKKNGKISSQDRVEDNVSTAENINIDGDDSVNLEFQNVIEASKEYTYKRFRKEFQERFTSKYKKLYPYVVLIPDIISLFIRLYNDKRVAKETKFNISIALGYLFFPLDIIPDTVPLVGKIDDLAVTFFILQKVLCDIPEEVILENWEGKSNIIEISRDAMSLLDDKFGTKEIKRMVDVVRISMKKTIRFFAK